MLEKKTLIAALMATTFLTAGAAYAADQAMQPANPQAAVDKDATKLSADGARAYNDLALTRLAIYDGRVADAKKLIADADTAFDKAKGDDSVFVKAEADLKLPDATASADMASAVDKGADAAGSSAKADQAKAGQANADQAKTDQTKQDQTKTAEMATPKRWLPIDADMSVDEDFTSNPAKAAAVADANKSLAKGDKTGAMNKLKLADVGVTYVMAVVPLDQTLTDVHQAAQLIDSGKYYEGSQMLRQVQDSTRYDVIEASGVPGKAAPAKSTAASSSGAKSTSTQ